MLRGSQFKFIVTCVTPIYIYRKNIINYCVTIKIILQWTNYCQNVINCTIAKQIFLKINICMLNDVKGQGVSFFTFISIFIWISINSNLTPNPWQLKCHSLTLFTINDDPFFVCKNSIMKIYELPQKRENSESVTRSRISSSWRCHLMCVIRNR